MATTIQIVNKALVRIGVRQFIDDLDEATAAAEIASVLFEPTRDEVLESNRWRFATQRSFLAVIEDAERTGWTYAYGLPTDCLSARYLAEPNGHRTPTAAQRIPFTVELNEDGDGKILLTDQVDAELVYTARVESSTLFPPLFCDALAWKLASEFAMALPVKEGLSDRALRMYELTLTRAAASSFEQSEEVEPESEFIQARG
jgi:hypothetical protein